MSGLSEGGAERSAVTAQSFRTEICWWSGARFWLGTAIGLVFAPDRGHVRSPCERIPAAKGRFRIGGFVLGIASLKPNWKTFAAIALRPLEFSDASDVQPSST